MYVVRDLCWWVDLGFCDEYVVIGVFGGDLVLVVVDFVYVFLVLEWWL